MVFEKASVPVPSLGAERMALLMAKRVVLEPPDETSDLIVLEIKDIDDERVLNLVSQPQPLLLVMGRPERPRGVLSITNGLVNWMEAGEIAILVAEEFGVPLRRIYMGTHYTRGQVEWFREKAREHGIRAQIIEMRSANLAKIAELSRGYDFLVIGKGRVVLGREALAPLVRRLIALLRMNTLLVGSLIFPKALIDMLLEPEEMLMHYCRVEAYVREAVEEADLIITEKRAIIHPSPPARVDLAEPIVIPKGEVKGCFLEEGWIRLEWREPVKLRPKEEPPETLLQVLRLLFR